MVVSQHSAVFFPVDPPGAIDSGDPVNSMGAVDSVDLADQVDSINPVDLADTRHAAVPAPGWSARFLCVCFFLPLSRGVPWCIVVPSGRARGRVENPKRNSIGTSGATRLSGRGRREPRREQEMTARKRAFVHGRNCTVAACCSNIPGCLLLLRAQRVAFLYDHLKYCPPF